MQKQYLIQNPKECLYCSWPQK